LPEKFAVFGPIGRKAKLSAESVESGSMTNCHGQNQLPEMAESRSAEAVFKGSKKLLDFPGLPAYRNHIAYPSTSTYVQHTYRQGKPLFICNFSYHSFKNRSV
jgi:hypothetical protein